METGNEEKNPLLDDTRIQSKGGVDTDVYARRWWILFMYCCTCITQGLVWNTWGPITQSAEAYFGWSDGTIGMLPNLGNIVFTVTTFPVLYFVDKKGLRYGMLACFACTFVGAAIRCITSDPDVATWLIFVCAFINGIAGVIFNAAPPLLAVTWFPPNQRTTATAIAASVPYLGTALSFIMGPLLVTSPVYANQTEETNISINTFMTTNLPGYRNKSVLTNVDALESDIMRLQYIECGIAGVLFIAVLIYFPKKPPKPPSITAALHRVEYKKSLLQIIQHGRLWLITLAFSLPIGILNVWTVVIDVIFNPYNVTQDEVGWLGFYSVIAGCIAGVVIARFSDLLMRHMKFFLILLFILAACSFGACILLCYGYIPFKLMYLYITVIAGTMALNGTIPLFFELSCETAYPINEGLTGGFLTCVCNTIGIGFLFALEIPNIGTVWMNWCLIGSIGLGFIFLIVFREKYTRTNIDMIVDPPENLGEEQE